MLIITHLYEKEFKLIKNIFKNNFNHIIFVEKYSNEKELTDKNEKLLFIYDKELYQFKHESNNIIFYEINKIFTCTDLINILKIINIDFSFYYQIFNNSIISNELIINNPTINFIEDKLIYIWNPHRIFDINGRYIYGQGYYDKLGECVHGLNIQTNTDTNIYNRTAFFLNNKWSFNYQCQFLELFPIIILIKLLINTKYKDDKNKIDIFFLNKYRESYLELFRIFEIDNDVNLISLNSLEIDTNSLKLYYKEIYDFGKNHLHRTITHKLLGIFIGYLKYYFKNKFDTLNWENDNKVALLRSNDYKLNCSPNRSITNINDIISILKNNNFNIINTENMSLEDKFKNLSYKKIIIIEAGASLPNLYFLKKNKSKIILLCNESMYYHHGIYEDQIRYYCKDICVIICKMSDSPQCNASTNNPYTIDINDITKLLN